MMPNCAEDKYMSNSTQHDTARYCPTVVKSCACGGGHAAGSPHPCVAATAALSAEIGALNYYSKPAEGFLEDYCRLVDFMSLHRIEGVTICGFLRDNHGGVEAAQELCRYANERGVRILPGVGINAYGGIYWEGEHRYNLTNWLRAHPELRAEFDKPVAFHILDLPKLWFPETHYTDAACPSKPENARYHEEAVRWLAETFEIGGINFETGDYGVCNCADCSARRGADETWSHVDISFFGHPEWHGVCIETGYEITERIWRIALCSYEKGTSGDFDQNEHM
jgi:hypothetical protein